MVAARRFLNLSPTFRGLVAMARTGAWRVQPAAGSWCSCAGSGFRRLGSAFTARRQIDSDIVAWRSLSSKSKRREVHDRHLSRSDMALVDRLPLVGRGGHRERSTLRPFAPAVQPATTARSCIRRRWGTAETGQLAYRRSGVSRDARRSGAHACSAPTPIDGSVCSRGHVSTSPRDRGAAHRRPCPSMRE
jgi:hypothetical protein